MTSSETLFLFGIRVSCIAGSRTLVNKFRRNLREALTDEVNEPQLEATRTRQSLPAPANQKKQEPSVYGISVQTLSTAIFSITFSESCLLSILVLFANSFSDTPARFNWNFSLSVLLLLVFFVIPLLACTLLSLNPVGKVSPLRYSIFIALYLGFHWLSYQLAYHFVDEAPNNELRTSKLVSSLLSQICIPGVILVAVLSALSSSSSIWNFIHYRRARHHSKANLENNVENTRASLKRTRESIQDIDLQLSLLKDSSVKTPDSFMSRIVPFRAQSSEKARYNALTTERSLYEAIERQTYADLDVHEARLNIYKMMSSFSGWLWLAIEGAVILYCIIRTFLALINVTLHSASSAKHPQPSSTPVSSEPQNIQTSTSRDEPSDLTTPTETFSSQPTSVVTHAAAVQPLLSWLAPYTGEMDPVAVGRIFNMAVTGGIIAMNLRKVLIATARLFSMVSPGRGTSFMLLVSSQLLTTYIVTTIIALPQGTTDGAANKLLATLPSFHVFSRLFDITFIITLAGSFFYRYIEDKYLLSQV